MTHSFDPMTLVTTVSGIYRPPYPHLRQATSRAQTVAQGYARITLPVEYSPTERNTLPAQPKEAIEITLPDGPKLQGRAWETKPAYIAKQVLYELAQRCVVAKVRRAVVCAACGPGLTCS